MLYKLISDNENAILLGHHSFIKYVFNKKNYEWDDKIQKLLFNIFILDTTFIEYSCICYRLMLYYYDTLHCAL